MTLTNSAVVADSDFDDLLPVSPLDLPLTLTIFAGLDVNDRKERRVTLREFTDEIYSPIAADKANLPLLKLARFGETRSAAGLLRNDANVLSIGGVEGDYDGEIIGLGDAAALLRAAGIAAMLYATPSHSTDKPRWRVLCPLGQAVTPGERARLCARLNGALGGILDGASFTLSQSYFYGRVPGATYPPIELVDGRPIDVADDLDAGALGKDGGPYAPGDAAPITADNDDDDDSPFPPDWERINSALAAIPVSAADTDIPGEKPTGRDLWLQIGMALHGESGGSADGFRTWEDWSQPGEKYNAKDQRAKWKSFGRQQRTKALGIGTLYRIAALYGWNQTDDDAEPARLQFLSPSDCAASPSRGYVVKGLLAPRDLACVFGAPGAGKSLIAPHLGYHVALDHPAFGMRVRPGKVFYVAAEDAHGMRGRVTALRMRHGDAPEFVLVDGVSDLLVEKSPDLAALREAVAEQKPALIFIDTLALAFPGLEENSAEAMGRVVAISRSLTVHGAAVVLIHHDTKAQGPTPRGHSLLNGALDVALQLFPRDENGIVRARLTKNRNGTCDRDIAFRIDTESLGEDDDGDSITVAIVAELLPGAAPARVKLTGAEAAAMRILDALSVSGSIVTEEEWRSACIDARTVSAADDRESRRKAAKRAFEGLARKGAVSIVDGIARHGCEMAADPFDDDDNG